MQRHNSHKKGAEKMSMQQACRVGGLARFGRRLLQGNGPARQPLCAARAFCSPPPKGEESKGAGDKEEEAEAKPKHAAIDHIAGRLRELNGRSTKRDTVLTDEQGNWGDGFGIVSAWKYLWARAGVAFVQRMIDRKFDEDEFLEGAEDAFITVYEMIGQESAEGLEKMVSPRLYDALVATRQDYAKEGITLKMTVVDVQDVSISGVHVALREQMKSYDPKLADLPVPEGDPEARKNFQYGAWLLVSVDIRSEEMCEIVNRDGHLVDGITDKRTQTWRFARGPLPGKLPQEDLDSRWIILDFV